MDVNRADEFRGKFEALVEEFADIFADGLTLPSIQSWVVMVACDDIGDMSDGFIQWVAAKGQWNHTSIGLCEMAKNAFLEMVRD